MTRFSEGDTQPLPKVKPPKYQPRHKKENNTGIKFLAVLAGLVLFLGIIAYVDWESLDDNQAKPEPSPSVPLIQPTVTVTETAQGKRETATVTAESSPRSTFTVTLTPSITPTVTTTATTTVPGPTVTSTKAIPGPTKTIIKCYDQNVKPIECPNIDGN